MSLKTTWKHLNATYWYEKGLRLDNVGKVERALKCYDHSLALNENNDFAWTNKGLILKGQVEYEEALVCFDRALAINPVQE